MRTCVRHRTPRGVTLIELAVVVAIIGIMAVTAYSISRAETRNVYLSQAASELALRATGLRSTALGDGQDYLLVVLDAPGNDASRCTWANSAACSRYFVLRSPQAAWTLNGFNPATPGVNASFVDSFYLPRGARFFIFPSYSAPPAPFGNVAVFDGRFYPGTCTTGACFAIRFTASGRVYAEQPGGGAAPTAPGFAFILASDAELEGAGGNHRGVVVGFPSGVAKTWSY